MTKNTKRIIFGILIVINCIIIFYFSNQVADDSSASSSKVVNFISEIIPQIKNMSEPDKTILKEEILTPIVRKGAHFSIYALLGLFTINFMYTFENKKIINKILISQLFCTIYAITDEIHQLFSFGRSGEIRDVIIDSLGALTGILIIILLKNIKRE